MDSVVPVPQKSKSNLSPEKHNALTRVLKIRGGETNPMLSVK